jgi:hypothetical protein
VRAAPTLDLPEKLIVAGFDGRMIWRKGTRLSLVPPARGRAALAPPAAAVWASRQRQGL